MSEMYAYKSYEVTLAIYAWIEEYFRLFYKSIDHIQLNKDIWREDGGNTCGRKDSTLNKSTGWPNKTN